MGNYYTSRKALIGIILCLAWNTFLYLVWQERNNRLFKQVESTAEVIIGGIKESGKLRLTRAGRVAPSRINLQLLEAWGLSDVQHDMGLSSDCSL
ncbi:hypothetical protein J1N35_005222 [Gossypium stocksii]|uniref:Uncharacterized protein n=1 Tax=Gossypium stocksii TaxID=47602 RepID=A0A9D3WE71_9ROSI|nr:hypothetical protein J1N35_005222 [Gossypium stocksii]